MEKLLRVCERAGIKTKPERIEDIWIVPLFSWYDSTLGVKDPLTRADIEDLKNGQIYIFVNGLKFVLFFYT